MTAEEHNRTLATLHYVYGGMHGLSLLGLLLLVFVARMATPDLGLFSPFWITVSVIAFLVLFVAVGLLPVLVAFGLSKKRRWAKPAALFLGIISLVNIPVGTALGIYAIKFLRSDAGARIYGGRGSATTNEQELQNAIGGARPLMDLANRFKQ